jgi:Na+/melibiose symporter-like transporter
MYPSLLIHLHPLSTLLLLPIGGLSHTSNTKRRLQLREDLLEGIRYVWQHPLLRGLALLSIGTNVMYSAVLATQILFIRDILGINSFGFGLLLSAAALSSILGSQSVTWLRDRVGTKNTLIISMLAIGISLGLVGVSSQWEVVGVLYMVEAFRCSVKRSQPLNPPTTGPRSFARSYRRCISLLIMGSKPARDAFRRLLVTGGEPV